MKLHICKNADEMAASVAEYMVHLIAATLKQKNVFSLVLSGGSTPKKLYLLLAQPQFKNLIEWNKIHIFFGDERFVPPNDERNNAHMAKHTFLEKVGIPEEHIHIMQTENTTPEESAAAYEKTVNDFFANNASSSNNTFDLVLLGMGDDAHTLSLFPGNADTIREENKNVISLWLEDQNMHRVTLTANVVNKAAAVLFMVSGSSKAKALHHVLEGKKDIIYFPAQAINPAHGELHWYADESAVQGPK